MALQILRMCVGILLVLAGTSASALAEKRVALLIGNSSYETLASLKTPANNVRALEQAFLKAGFDKVDTGLDLNRTGLAQKLRAFENEASSADIAVLYFSGRALEHKGKGFVLATEAKLASERELDDEAVSVDRLLRAMDGAKSLKFLILDAARDDPLGSDAPQHSRCCEMPEESADRASLLVLYATKAGRALPEGGEPVDAFTRSLAARLFERGEDVSLALRKVRDDVLAASAGSQETFAYGSLVGGPVALVK